MKKILALVLCIVLTVSAFSGCGNSDASTQTKAPETTTKTESAGAVEETTGEASAEGEWTGEITKIVMAFPTAGVEPTDLDKVEAAVNEISTKKIGVEVEFKPVSLFEAPSQIPMWIGAGEQLDIMFMAFTGTAPFVAQNMLLPLDEYLPGNGEKILELAQAGEPIFDFASPDANYAVMTLIDYGYAGGYLISVDHLEAAGLSYNDGDMVTLEDLDKIFAAIKEVKPEVYPCGVLATDRSAMTMVRDTLGATNASGTTIGLDSTTIVNYYESEEFKEYIQYARKWYEAGYILKDAATSDYSLTELVKNDTISGYFSEGAAMFPLQLKEQTGRDYIHLMLNEPYAPSITPAANTYWGIPVTSENPEAAVRFLNLWYEDPYVTNLMVFGIPGEHIVWVDEAQGIITYPEGVDPTTSTYAYGYGLFGINRSSTNWSMGAKTIEADKKWVDTANSRKTAVFGYSYNPAAMTNQIIAIEAVITEYSAALTTGSADIDKVYPEFIEKLKANGIDEVIADNQAQLDAWLAQQ